MQQKLVSDVKPLSLLRTLVREALDGFGNKNAGKDKGNLLRYDVPVQRHGGNVLTDEQEEEDKAKQDKMLAATVLCIAEDGKVLAVSRRDDPTAFGLPGGKVDPDESPIEAAARELFEERGLIATDLKPVFVRGDADGYTTTTFVGHVSGNIKTDEEGVVRWVDPEVLFAGPFGEYNRRLWKKLGRLK